MRTFVLMTALLPYLSFLAVDTWYHEKKRVVPPIEKGMHAAIIIGLVIFFYCAFQQYTLYAYIALAPTLICMAVDEVVYHQHLKKNEKLLHLGAGISLALFLGFWIWMS